MMTEEMKKAVREMISEYMDGAASETDKLMEHVVAKLAETMDIHALEMHAVHEIGELLDCLSRGDTEGILHEFAELKIVMCAIKRHLPDGVTMRVWQDAVEGYAKKYGVE